MTHSHKPDIHLRAMEPEDLDMLYTIENDQQLWGVSATNVPYSRYTLHDYIANAAGDIYTDRQVRLIIENAEHDVIGILDLINFDPRHRRAEVGIVIQQPYRSQGYAQAALAELHKYASQVLFIHQLYAIVSLVNKQAVDLFLSMGYQHTATLRDWLYDGTAYHDGLMLQLQLL